VSHELRLEPKDSGRAVRLLFMQEVVGESMQAGRARDAIPGIRDGFLADDREFRAWYEAALPRVYGYLLARCGRDRELAEELTQQTFVAAIGARGGPAGDDPLAWVIGIARHRLVDHFRAVERRERGFLRLVSRSSASAVTWLGESEREGLLVAALQRLPAAQRAAVTLRYVDDLPVREVAALLGRSEGAVESLLSRGREALRRATGDER
jgi:RNA polymerase sigma-70 factor (ECF subfamily)